MKKMITINNKSNGFGFNGAGIEVKAGRTFVTGRPYIKASVSDNTMNLAVGFVTLAASAKLVAWTGKTAATLANNVKAHFTGKPSAEEDFMEQ